MLNMQLIQHVQDKIIELEKSIRIHIIIILLLYNFILLVSRHNLNGSVKNGKSKLHKLVKCTVSLTTIRLL